MMTEEDLLVQEILADINCQSRRGEDANTAVDNLYPTTETDTAQVVTKVGSYDITLTHFLLAVIAFLLLLNLCTK